MPKKRESFSKNYGKSIKDIRLSSTVINDFIKPSKKKKCDAIIDTGATITAIIPKIVNELQLERAGETKVSGIGEPGECRKKYIATIILPNGIKIDQEIVSVDIPGADLLIGIDLLSKCDFAQTHSRTGEIIFSLAYPPTGKTIEF